MADLTSGAPPVSNGRAQNGGSRTTAGPIPVPQNPSERVRTPTDIMRERRDREARKKAEMERQKEQEIAAQRRALVREPAAAGDAPADIGTRERTRRTSGSVPGARRSAGETLLPEEVNRRTRDRKSSGAADEPPPVVQPQGNPSSGSTQVGQSIGPNAQARGPDTSNIPQPTSTRRRTQSQGQPTPVQAQPATSRVVSQPQPRVGQTSTAAATAQTQPKPSATGSTTRNPNPQGASFDSQPRSTTSSFPHAFERWETLSSHWEGLTSFWIRRLESNKDEVDKNPLNSQLARQVNDLSAAGANLFHAVVELQRLRASSERKFQRWFFETRAEQEKANELRAGLEEALRQERSAKADAVAALTRVETDKNSAYQNRSTAEQMLKEMKRELDISKQEARRAWEELGRREQEERDRTSSLKNGQPTLVGGVQVVPMTQGGQANSNRPSTRDGPFQQGPSVRSGPESVESPVRGDPGYTNYDAARSDTDTDPFTEGGANRSRQAIPPLPNTIPQPQPTSNASAAALQAAQSAALQSGSGATPLNHGGTYLRYGPAATGLPSPSFYQHEGSSLLPEGQQVRTTEADERSYVPSVPDTNSQEEYEMNSNGEVQRDEHGRPVPYRGDLGSEDSDEYDVQDQLERERMYGQRYGSGISGVEYGSGSPAVAGSTGTQADYSGSGYGAAPGWEAVPRHHHPTRLSDLKSRNQSGPFSLRSAVLFLTAGAGLIFYFRYEKERLERKKIAEQAKGIGKPKVGGKFELVDQDGRAWSEQNLKGGFTLVYFGFSHCPDICPDELDKMARIIDLVNGPPTADTAPIPSPSPPSSPSSTDPTASPTKIATPALPQKPSEPPVPRPPILPLFMSCDPARDTPEVLKTYLKEFHPSLVGLTGTWQQVKDVCKAYRVYFSTPEGAKPGMDYLVDHSIYFYVMGMSKYPFRWKDEWERRRGGWIANNQVDPDGDFVECIGRQNTAESAASIIKEHMSDWKNGVKVR
ncbi:MAG: hypothetical protein Q9218_001072 [Villophora microphyllina]